jgi:hypothetical protein
LRSDSETRRRLGINNPPFDTDEKAFKFITLGVFGAEALETVSEWPDSRDEFATGLVGTNGVTQVLISKVLSDTKVRGAAYSGPVVRNKKDTVLSLLDWLRET